MIAFNEIKIHELVYEDLDMDYPFYSGDDENEVSYSLDIDSDGCSINIDKAIKALQYLKSLKSERVYIQPNIDHHGYSFTGVQFEKI